jgi:hypothetical protein
MDYIYTVVDSGGAFPCAFTTYADALAEVKDKYKESWQKDCGAEVKNKTYDYWSSQQDDEDDLEEGSKLDDEDDSDENVTQIWIDVHVGIVTIYRLKIKR